MDTDVGKIDYDAYIQREDENTSYDKNAEFKLFLSNDVSDVVDWVSDIYDVSRKKVLERSLVYGYLMVGSDLKEMKYAYKTTNADIRNMQSEFQVFADTNGEYVKQSDEIFSFMKNYLENTNLGHPTILGRYMITAALSQSNALKQSQKIHVKVQHRSLKKKLQHNFLKAISFEICKDQGLINDSQNEKDESFNVDWNRLRGKLSNKPNP